MKGLENSIYLVGYIISNIIGILFLWAAIKKPVLARLMFVLLFCWASGANYYMAHQNPDAYLSYADASIKWYADFINGWFRHHITEMVTLIAIGEALIALGMLLKGWWVKLACIGVIIFQIAIAPLGAYSAFPFSITVSLAAFFILKRDKFEYLWKFKRNKKIKR